MWWLKKWTILCPNNYCTGIPSPFNVHICHPKKYSIQISVLFWGVPFSSSLYHPQSETGFKPVLSFTFNRMKMHLSFFFNELDETWFQRQKVQEIFFLHASELEQNGGQTRPTPIHNSFLVPSSLHFFFFYKKPIPEY